MLSRARFRASGSGILLHHRFVFEVAGLVDVAVVHVEGEEVVVAACRQVVVVVDKNCPSSKIWPRVGELDPQHGVF